MHAKLMELATAAGEIARQHFDKLDHDVDAKGRSDYVTHVDRLIEDELTARIRSAFPSHAVLGEETANGRAPSRFSGPTWIIDPIDGTTNFLRGIPAFTVSIAFCEQDLEPRYAVIYDPIHNELFRAERGAAAWLGNERIYSSGCRELSAAIVACSLPFRSQEPLADVGRVVVELQERCDDHRRTGSAALEMAWVACGRIDAYWELGIYPWDTAAGELLVRCAGGSATDFRSEHGALWSRRSIVAAATPELHHALLAHVAALDHWLDDPRFA
jgi:myo-inositol-1(or 4)-monophosphatase